MSLIIGVYVNEGIVLASDRRVTYTNTQEHEGKIIQRIGIHTTNSTDKTFICPNGVGISTCGDASFQNRPITGFIQEMIRTRIGKECAVQDVPQIIIDYFNGFSAVPDTTFIVAGYEKDETQNQQLLYRVHVKTDQIETVDTKYQGAIWNGEIFTLTRLINNVACKNADGQYQDLPYEDILWQYFTLQDAIDFARYAVETTIQTMRFKNVIETVGGTVDILVITPTETRWLQKEDLR